MSIQGFLGKFEGGYSINNDIPKLECGGFNLYSADLGDTQTHTHSPKPEPHCSSKDTSLVLFSQHIRS